MTKFGAWASNAVTPMGELYFQQSPGATLTVAGENFFAMGAFTMPFAGHLQCELTAELEWVGEPAVAIWMSIIGSPAVSISADPGVCHHGIDVFKAWHEPRTHAGWYSLAAGTVVTGTARIYCTAANVAVVHHVAGFWRPAPT